MSLKSTYFFVMVIIFSSIYISTADLTEAEDVVNSSKAVIDGIGKFVKEEWIPEKYRPVLEPVVDVATQTINDNLKDKKIEDLIVKGGKSMIQSFRENVSVPSSECVNVPIATSISAATYSSTIVVIEIAVAYFFINDASLSRQFKDQKLQRLNQIIVDIYQDSRITNCLEENSTRPCDMNDFQKAKDKFIWDMENILEDVKEHADWKKNVILPAAKIAAAGFTVWALYKIYSLGYCVSSFFYTSGAGVSIYGAHQQYVTYEELKKEIEKMRNRMKEEEEKLQNSIINMPSEL